MMAGWLLFGASVLWCCLLVALPNVWWWAHYRVGRKLMLLRIKHAALRAEAEFASVLRQYQALQERQGHPQRAHSIERPN